MPRNATPGTPSISNGSRMPCQWIEVGSSSPLRTRRVTVCPSRKRSRGAGTLPLTVTALLRRPSIRMGVRSITRSYSPGGPSGSAATGTPPALRAQAGSNPCRAPSAPAAAVVRNRSLRVIIAVSSRDPRAARAARPRGHRSSALRSRPAAIRRTYWRDRRDRRRVRNGDDQRRRTGARPGGDRALPSGGLQGAPAVPGCSGRSAGAANGRRAATPAGAGDICFAAGL